MTRSMIRPMIRSMITSMINPDSGILERIFITLDSTQSSHYLLSTPIVMANDFTAGSKAILPTSATNYTILGQTASALNYFKILSTGFASISIDGDIVTSTVAATKDSKLRDYGVRLNGNDFEFLEDGVIIDTVTDAVAAAKTFTIDAIGVSNGADFFDNALADTSFNNNGTITSWNLDEETQNIELPNENVFGIEEVSNGDFSSGTTDWVSVNSILTSPSDNLNVQNNGVNFGRADQSLSGLTIGNVYQVTAGTVDTTGNIPAKLVLGTSSAILGSGNIGSLIIFFTATSTTHSLQLQNNSNNSNASVKWDDISVKEVTNALTYVLIPEGAPDRELFTFIDGEWVGQDIVINGNFDAGLTSWDNPSGAWSSSAGQATAASLTDPSEALRQVILTVGHNYNLSFFSGGATGNLIFEEQTPEIAANASTSGEITTGTFTALEPTGRISFKRENDMTNAFLDNVIIKRRIEVA